MEDAAMALTKKRSERADFVSKQKTLYCGSFKAVKGSGLDSQLKAFDCQWYLLSTKHSVQVYAEKRTSLSSKDLVRNECKVEIHNGLREIAPPLVRRELLPWILLFGASTIEFAQAGFNLKVFIL